MNNDDLFPKRPYARVVQRVERRRRMRGELVPRRVANFDWADDGRIDDCWDECAAVTVVFHNKLGGSE